MSLEPFARFSLHRIPELHFGTGSLDRLPSLLAAFGRQPMIVTGGRSFAASGRLDPLLAMLERASFACRHVCVEGEPSPELVDAVTALGRESGTDVVVAIGGGSVIDTGKAVSAMLLQEYPVERFIEGCSDFLWHDGRKVPFLAVPTTSGTGSEATSNAVLSRIGKEGFKRSLRHRTFVPEVALIDPELLCSPPKSLTVASGMDAVTQLLESYVSPSASPFTDVLALQGLRCFSRSFPAACSTGSSDPAVRADLAYAAFLSGITLCNAGLGIVHGLASSLGGRYDIPHGVLCATLLAEATEENIRQLRRSSSGSAALALRKYADAGRLLSGRSCADDKQGCSLLVATLREWSRTFDVPTLGAYGVLPEAVSGIVSVTRSKNNPVDLDAASIERILFKRL